MLLAWLLFLAALQTPATPAQPHGAFGLRNQQFGLYLRPRDANSADGTPIVLYPFQTWRCMAWQTEDVPQGTRLVNFFTHKSFEIQAADTKKPLAQAPATPDRQKSEALHFILLPDGLYEIQSGEGAALTAVQPDPQGEIRVIAAPWKDTPAQKWKLTAIPEHFTG